MYQVCLTGYDLKQMLIFIRQRRKLRSEFFSSVISSAAINHTMQITEIRSDSLYRSFSERCFMKGLDLLPILAADEFHRVAPFFRLFRTYFVPILNRIMFYRGRAHTGKRYDAEYRGNPVIY